MKVNPTEANYGADLASDCAEGSSAISHSSSHSNCYSVFDESCFTGSYSVDEHNGVRDSASSSEDPSDTVTTPPPESEETFDRRAVFQTATLKNLAMVLETQAVALEKAGRTEEAARFRVYASQKLSNACTRILKK